MSVNRTTAQPKNINSINAHCHSNHDCKRPHDGSGTRFHFHHERADETRTLSDFSHVLMLFMKNVRQSLSEVLFRYFLMVNSKDEFDPFT